jgi:hypothetical protein
VLPANAVDAINAYGLVYDMKDRAYVAAQNAPMKMPLFPELVSKLPAFRDKIHMLRQKPPSIQPSPSVNSLKTRHKAPKTTPVKKAATKYAPCTASDTGGLIT